MLGVLTPLLLVSVLGQQPHHPGMKPGTPVSPALALVPPPPVLGVHGKEIGVSLDRRAHLDRGELIDTREPRNEHLSINFSWFGH